MINIINFRNIGIALCSSVQFSSVQFSYSLNLSEIFASFFDALKIDCHGSSLAMTIGSIAMAIKNTVIANALKRACCQVKQSKFNKINFNNLLQLINDYFGSSLRNDDKLNSEIISLNNKNKNLKLNNYYGFLFNKKISLSKGGIEQ